MDNLFIESSIKQYLFDVLNVIHMNYPKIFTKNLKDKWEKVININLSPLNENIKKKLELKIKKYYVGRVNMNTGHSLKRNIKIPLNERCIARVWGNGKITKSKKETIYGDRCSKHKLKDSKYCHIHINNNVHGDFNKKPNDKIIYNYNKHHKDKDKDKTDTKKDNKNK